MSWGLLLLRLRPPKSRINRLVPQPLGIALSATTPPGEGVPGRVRPPSQAAISRRVLLCLHRPTVEAASKRLAMAVLREPIPDPSSLPFSPSPPQRHSCLYGSSLGCSCQPICSVPYASRKDCQVETSARRLDSSPSGWTEAFSAQPGR